MRGATKECQLRPRLFDFFVCLGKQKGMAIVRGVFVWGKTKELLDDEKWVGEMRRCLLRCFPDLKEGFEEEEEPSSPPSTASSSSPCSSPCDELPWVTNEHFFDTICGFHPMNECTWLAYVIDGVVVGVSAITYYHDSGNHFKNPNHHIPIKFLSQPTHIYTSISIYPHTPTHTYIHNFFQ